MSCVPLLSIEHTHRGLELRVCVPGGRGAAGLTALLLAIIVCAWGTGGQVTALVAALLLLFFLSYHAAQVTTESIVALNGGAGYILEGRRRCGLPVRPRFVDARDVEYIAIGEAVSSIDVRFFLGIALKDDTNRIEVPYQRLLPHLRLRHLEAAYRELMALREPPRGDPGAAVRQEAGPGAAGGGERRGRGRGLAEGDAGAGAGVGAGAGRAAGRQAGCLEDGRNAGPGGGPVPRAGTKAARVGGLPNGPDTGTAATADSTQPAAANGHAQGAGAEAETEGRSRRRPARRKP
ncbi:hypothetical protein HYH03_000045 [Edaphochlamys debaryana]|uniref:GPI-GlcNAc transferase complex PIG-H component conserved domain-containing protein n=1 Tax=Edaphochlamys debaryana TaxID=47281 RepID=A0A836C6U6_9CHLO|nr:hypothetical protein HYH03_000045 [Edaphochlamys debaryana]|eukprot:KAG2501538.1 hypothetical protein HYH03_000045 [Edaphochlamys debaryana]